MSLTEEQKKELLSCQDCNINTFSLKGQQLYCKIVNIYDADTCRVVFFLNNQLVKYTLRLIGVDSPEMKPPLKDQYRRFQIKEAKKARNRLIQLSTDCEIEVETDLSKLNIQKLINSNQKIIKINCEEFDKYGRLLASIFSEDININAKLVEEGYAYNYGGGKKQNFDYSKYINNDNDNKKNE